MSDNISSYTSLPDDIDVDESGMDSAEDTRIDMNTLLDDYFIAKMKVVALEQENSELRSKINSLQRWKEQIEHVMMNDTMNKHSNVDNITKKEKQPRQRTNDQECFVNFCNVYKKDAVTLARVSAKVSTLGYTGFKKLPWSIVKLELRSMYNNLSDVEKIKYLNKSSNSQ